MNHKIPDQDLKTAFLDALYMGNGIADLLKIGELHLNRPIFVYNTSYHLIAASPMALNIPKALERSRNTSFLRGSEIERMVKYKVIDRIYETRSAFWGQDKDHPEMFWAFCSLRIRDALVGYVTVCDYNDAPSQEVLDCITLLSHVLSIELQKQDFFTSKTGLKYEYFLTALLDGQFDSREVISTRLKALDGTLLPYIYILCISAPDSLDNNYFNKAVSTKARSCFSHCMSVVYHKNLVLLVSQNHLIDFEDKNGNDFAQFLRLNQIKAGISQPFSDPLYISQYYQQARECLILGLSLMPAFHFYLAEQYLPYQLMEDSGAVRLHTLQHHLYHKLKEYDKTCRTELVKTLREYLKQNRNSTAAAAVLNIHRTTFFYRIKKIEEILDISITDCGILFLFELSFYMEEYLEKVCYARTE